MGEMPSPIIDLYCHVLRSGLRRADDARPVTDLHHDVMRHLLSARLYSVPGETYAAVFDAVEGRLRDQVRPDAEQCFHDAIVDLAAERPFTATLPFRSIFVGLVGGVPLSEADIGDIRGFEAPDPNAKLTATLFIEDAGGVTVLEFIDYQRESWVIRICDAGVWKRPFGLECHALPMLTQLLMQPAQVVRTPQSNMDRHVMRKLGKHHKLDVTREPFYSISIGEPEVRRFVGRVLRRPARAPRHSFDVRGTMRLKIRRGSLPLDPRLEATLIKRGWTIIADGQPDASWSAELDARGHEGRRCGEWLACLLRPVSAGVKYAGTAPYVPALRKVG